MYKTAAAVLISWALAGLLRTGADLFINAHIENEFYALALDGAWQALLAAEFLPLVAASMAMGLLVARLARTRNGGAAATTAAIATFWVLLASCEIANRTSYRDVMTQEIVFSQAHLAIVLIAAAGILATRLALLSTRGSGFLVGLAVLIVLASGACKTAGLGIPTLPPDAPNVLLISIDTLRPDHLGVYGYERNTSPSLGRLAERSIVYEQAISQAPNTHPSMASMLTSQYPSEHGTGGVKYIPYSAPTIAELLRNAGYETAAIVSNVWLKRQMGFDQGFAYFDQKTAMSEFYAEQDRIDEKNAASVTEAALAWLDAPRTRPFLLWLHYLDPHHPYDPPPPYDTMFSTKPDEHAAFVDELAAMPTREQTRRLVRIGSGEESVSEGEFQAIIDRYDGEIAFTDMQIGRVLDRIEARGLARDTMIVVTADHGEEFRDHQAWGHSHTLHRELLHVPLMIKYPGGVSSPRERLRMRVRLLDIAPTIAEAIGLPSPKAMKGEPLQNAGPHDRTAVSLLTRKKRLSIEKEGWKLITAGDDGDAELYDLSQDPHEHEDLIAAEPEIAAGLVHDLEALVGRNAMAEDIRETAARLDSSTRRQLEALGYVD